MRAKGHGSSLAGRFIVLTVAWKDYSALHTDFSYLTSTHHVADLQSSTTGDECCMGGRIKLLGVRVQSNHDDEAASTHSALLVAEILIAAGLPL